MSIMLDLARDFAFRPEVIFLTPFRVLSVLFI